MALPGCKDCGRSMIGSHKISVNGKRCDSCYMKRQRNFGNNYFCSGCLYAASGNTGKSFAMNRGLCEGCYNGRNRNNIADTAYIKGKYGGSSSGSSSGGCFITTATLSALGKGDECDELQTFRNYRDTYLLNEIGGKRLIREYYQKAPIIVAKIDTLKNSEEIYKSIWKNDLQKCYELIKNGNFIKARKGYVNLVNRLKSEFYLS